MPTGDAPQHANRLVGVGATARSKVNEGVTDNSEALTMTPSRWPNSIPFGRRSVNPALNGDRCYLAANGVRFRQAGLPKPHDHPVFVFQEAAPYVVMAVDAGSSSEEGCPKNRKSHRFGSGHPERGQLK